MNSLKSLNLLSVYRTENNDLYKDFYQPILSCAIKYDRAVGFFSSSILTSSLKGISKIINSNGYVRLIIGQPLEHDEYEAIKNASTQKKQELVSKYMDDLLEMMQSEDSYNQRLLLLGYLVAINKIEIKYALRKKGMYHEKIGIVYDDKDNIVVFQGSANETPSAFFEGINSECISVYKNWNEEIFNEYGKEYIYAFEKLWNNENKNTLTLNVLSEQYQRINAYIQENIIKNTDSLELERIFIALDNELEEKNPKFQNIPILPKFLGINPFEIRYHQKDALKKWKANEFKGILQHATGSGKTITALYALTKIFEAKQKNNHPLCVIISVPYIDLANQWAKEASNFNIIPVRCYENKNHWYDNLKLKTSLFTLNQIPFLCILVVNKTLVSLDFQNLISGIPAGNLMLIGDECHRHAAEETRKSLPDARFRLGLSATPFIDDENEIDSPFTNYAKENLLKYYESIVDEYTLEDAINDNILTPYKYHIIPTYLSHEEQEEYDSLSYEIGKIISQSNKKLTKSESTRLSIISSQRSRLLGSAVNKLSALNSLIKSIPKDERKLSLVYVGEGKNNNDDKIIDEVSKILRANNWKTAQFIGSTPKSERKNYLEMFKNQQIDALVAMKVLDEGIDVPACKTAFILASTKNPRQYIQRRGRVLRKYPEKNIANIYDFITLPNSDYQSSYAKTLKASELERIQDFTLLAINKVDIESIIDSLELRNV
jgi:superfamily II DNA or RNA helicase